MSYEGLPAFVEVILLRGVKAVIWCLNSIYYSYDYYVETMFSAVMLLLHFTDIMQTHLIMVW